MLVVEDHRPGHDRSDPLEPGPRPTRVEPGFLDELLEQAGPRDGEVSDETCRFRPELSALCASERVAGKRIHQRGRFRGDENALASTDAEHVHPWPLGELEPPRPLRPRPQPEPPRAGLVRLLVTSPEEARKGAIGHPSEQASLAEEALGFVERFERQVGREPASSVALAQQLGEAHGASYTRLVEPARSAAIVTIGNELLSGDVENTNGSWLARRLEAIGVPVRLIAVLPDDIEAIAEFIRTSSGTADVVLVTGGLGGTPDDITREAISAAFSVEQEEVPDLADELRARFLSDPEYAARWAQLPVGSRPLENPLGGAPGFAIENVYVLPGLPSEMEAMYERIEPELAAERPIGSWRRSYRTRESTIVNVLVESAKLHPGVLVGSYPRFSSAGPEVDVVLKSADPEALRAAVAWIEEALDEVTTP